VEKNCGFDAARKLFKPPNKEKALAVCWPLKVSVSRLPAFRVTERGPVGRHKKSEKEKKGRKYGTTSLN